MVNPVFVIPGTVPAPRAGLLREFHSRYETVREALARIDKAARELDLPDVLTRLTEGEGPPGRGADTQYLEIFAVSIAVHHALVAEGVEPFAIVGQSVGELWALAAAGHLTVEDAARLAVARSRALTRQAWPGEMLAVGIDGRRAEHLAGLVGHPDLVLACENAPRQSVVSGPAGAIAAVEGVADVLGWPHTRLGVPHPTHTPAVATAARDLLGTAQRVPYGAGRWRIWSPWLGREIGDDDPVELVAGALTARVRLMHTIRDLHAAGADVFVECGERAVVANLVEATVPDVRCVVPLAEPDPVGVIRALLAGGAPPLPSGSASMVTRVKPIAEAPAAASVPVPAVAPGSVLAAPDGLDQAAVLAELRTIYGEYLGYPPDLLGEDDALEADLGVESLKQVNLLARVADQYGLPDLRGDASLLSFGTLRRIAEAVVQTSAERA
jgi:[acyl-carrier-protein] S-malonyltransferase